MAKKKKKGKKDPKPGFEECRKLAKATAGGGEKKKKKKKRKRKSKKSKSVDPKCAKIELLEPEPRCPRCGCTPSCSKASGSGTANRRQTNPPDWSAQAGCRSRNSEVPEITVLSTARAPALTTNPRQNQQKVRPFLAGTAGSKGIPEVTVRALVREPPEQGKAEPQGGIPTIKLMGGGDDDDEEEEEPEEKKRVFIYDKPPKPPQWCGLMPCDGCEPLPLVCPNRVMPCVTYELSCKEHRNIGYVPGHRNGLGPVCPFAGCSAFGCKYTQRCAQNCMVKVPCCLPQKTRLYKCLRDWVTPQPGHDHLMFVFNA